MGQRNTSESEVVYLNHVHAFAEAFLVKTARSRFTTLAEKSFRGDPKSRGKFGYLLAHHLCDALQENVVRPCNSDEMTPLGMAELLDALDAGANCVAIPPKEDATVLTREEFLAELNERSGRIYSFDPGRVAVYESEDMNATWICHSQSLR